MEVVITGQIVCSLSLLYSVNFVPVQYNGVGGWRLRLFGCDKLLMRQPFLPGFPLPV